LPGTVDQHPNWQRKLRLDIETWMSDKDIQAMTDTLNAERNSRSEPDRTMT
jgi:4-alpha-glucanotransferase